MANQNYSDLEIAAVQFVELLTPGNFVEAQKWLSPDCEYKYGDKKLHGSDIIKSFSDNHNHAASKLDKIEYGENVVEFVQGRTVSVIVTDHLTAKGHQHTYKDRLIITFGENIGHGSVIQIENKRVEGERAKLYSFFDSIWMDWPRSKD